MNASELLDAVTFDDRLSTVYAEVYWSRVGGLPLRRKVVYEPRTGNWTCHGATTLDAAEGHIARAKRVRAIRWWLALIGDYSDEALALLVANRRAIQLDGLGNADDQAAIDAADIIRERRQSRAA